MTRKEFVSMLAGLFECQHKYLGKDPNRLLNTIKDTITSIDPTTVEGLEKEALSSLIEHIESDNNRRTKDSTTLIGIRCMIILSDSKYYLMRPEIKPLAKTHKPLRYIFGLK